jgi:two-component system, LytTR family, sensor kinase
MLFYISTLISLVIFYVNYLLLIPRYFFTGKKIRYFFSVLILITVFYFVSEFSGRVVLISSGFQADKPAREQINSTETESKQYRILSIETPSWGIRLSSYCISSMFIIFFSLGLRGLERHSHVESARKELERMKLDSELAFLKNQISPHFFFNTLNNIYSLIDRNTEDSKKALIRFSRLMRYILYDTKQDLTKLSREIEFMNNYIDLMKLRITDSTALQVNFPATCDNIEIPPFLFISLIENAFKHGVGFRENAFIRIDLECDGKNIHFSCVNSFEEYSNSKLEDHSGIGLENIRKRLELLFAGRHEFRITKSVSTFDVQLNIHLT